METFSRPQPETPAAREAIGLRPGDFMIVQVARLDPLKDHWTALRAVQRVAGKHPEVRLVLVGGGPEEENIERGIRALGLEKNVRMLGFRADCAPLLQAADIFLLTSLSEGIPVTVIEAMAAGLPVVSTDVGGLREVVLEGETGLLAPAGDDGALANLIAQLIESPALRRQMGRRGQERAGKLFSQERMHGSYCRVYDEMLAGRR
jgi:glycosyltransferase involved in cell wall biosynthesis